ncbi:MAG: helix-turn-helix domain-containing protein [Anaeromyxobacter sp.]
MRNDFDELMNEIEAEARRAGPKSQAGYARAGATHRLAREIFDLRKVAGLSQRQLAARSGVQQADISRIEAGDANPTLATISALAYALGAELSLARSVTGTRATGRGPKRRDSGTRQVRVRAAARRAASRR